MGFGLGRWRALHSSVATTSKLQIQLSQDDAVRAQRPSSLLRLLIVGRHRPIRIPIRSFRVGARVGASLRAPPPFLFLSSLLAHLLVLEPLELLHDERVAQVEPVLPCVRHLLLCRLSEVCNARVWTSSTSLVSASELCEAIDGGDWWW